MGLLRCFEIFFQARKFFRFSFQPVNCFVAETTTGTTNLKSRSLWHSLGHHIQDLFKEHLFLGGESSKETHPRLVKVHGQENCWVKIFHIFITQKLLGPKILWVSRFPTKKLTISGISGDKILRHTDMTVKCLAFDDRGLTQYWNKHV